MIPLNVVLATMTTRGTFNASQAEPGSASHSGRAGFNHLVPLMTADDAADMLFPIPVNHVKIDVDGAELGVIEGGRTLWKQVDSIMVESQPPTIDDISVILSGAGLQLVDSWRRLGDTPQHNYLFKRT